MIAELIDRRHPPAYPFADWGAIICGLVCLLMHPISITPLGIAESLTTFAAIYGMLAVRRSTGNAWGCIFAFFFIWNAI